MSNDKPWLDEPDHHLFESHGYVCEARRHEPLSHWCGYIYIPMTHPYAGHHYDSAELTVHGGLTYAEGKEDTWCFGFDCGHYKDYVPSRQELYDKLGVGSRGGEVYRTLPFVINELENLAQQLKEKENAN